MQSKNLYIFQKSNCLTLIIVLIFRYPWLEIRRNREEWKTCFLNLDFQKEIITIMNCIKNLQHFLFALHEYESLITQEGRDEYNILLDFIAKDYTIFLFIWIELERIIYRKWSRYNSIN